SLETVRDQRSLESVTGVEDDDRPAVLLRLGADGLEISAEPIRAPDLALGARGDPLRRRHLEQRTVCVVDGDDREPSPLRGNGGLRRRWGAGERGDEEREQETHRGRHTMP